MLSKFPLLRFPLVCFVLLLAKAAAAQTINVGPGQTYTTIQAGINAAVNGQTVLVAPGTYYENIDFQGKAITVVSSGGAATTIINGASNGPTVYLGTGYGQIPTASTGQSVLDGFTVEDGGTVQYQFPPRQGGIDIEGNATVKNNTISNNSNMGIFIGTGDIVVQNNHILNNGGLGILVAPVPYFSNYASTITIQGNLIEQNPGNGIVVYYAIPGTGNYPYPMNFSIIGNTVRGNGGSVAGTAGISIYSFGGTYVVANNLIYGSSGPGLAMALSAEQNYSPAWDPSSSIVNNTLYSNGGDGTAEEGTEIELYGPNNQLYNNIFYHGLASALPTVYCGSLSFPILFDHNDTYSPLAPAIGGCATSGSGNLSNDPLFVNAASNIFQLLIASPEIDSGNNNAPGLPATDIAGNPRIQDATNKGTPIIDLGAYEHGATRTETLVSSLNPSVYGQSVMFTAQLLDANGTPTGTVQFNDGSTALSVQAVSSTGTSTYTTSTLAVGSHTMTAVYQPTGTFSAATASLTQVVTGEPTSTTLTCSPGSLFQFGNANLIAAVSSTYGTPTGSITFADNGTTLTQSTLVNGSVSTSYYAQSLGTRTITATYVPTGAFAGSSATCSVVVSMPPSTTTLVSLTNPSNIGQSVTFTANVTYGGPPVSFVGGGAITFSDGSTPLQTVTLVQTGTMTFTASYTTSALTGGSHVITATLTPVTGYAASSAMLTQMVNRVASATVLTVSPATAVYGASVGLTATVAAANPPGAGTPTGTVTFLLSGALVGTGTIGSGGVASVSTQALPGGTDQVTCLYLGDTDYASSPCNVVSVAITGAPTTTALGVAPSPAYAGQTVTLTANVGATGSTMPGGTVTFLDAGTAIGAGTLSAAGQATLTTAALAVGTHPLSASYGASGNFAGSSSAVVNEVILVSGFTIAVSPGTMTLAPGASGSAAIELGSVGNFAGPLALSYGSLPMYATGSLSSNTVTLAAGGGGSSTLTLDTLVKAAGAAPMRPGSRGTPLVFATAMLMLVPLGFARRNKLARLLGLAAAVVAMQMVTGCTNRWYVAEDVTPGTYQVPITATDMNHNSQTATLTIVVTP